MKLNKYRVLNKWNNLLLAGILGALGSLLALNHNFGFTIFNWLNKGYTDPWILGTGLLRMWYTWIPSIMWFLYSLVIIRKAYKKITFTKLITETIEKTHGSKNRK